MGIILIFPNSDISYETGPQGLLDPLLRFENPWPVSRISAQSWNKIHCLMWFQDLRPMLLDLSSLFYIGIDLRSTQKAWGHMYMQVCVWLMFWHWTQSPRKGHGLDWTIPSGCLIMWPHQSPTKAASSQWWTQEEKTSGTSALLPWKCHHKHCTYFSAKENGSKIEDLGRELRVRHKVVNFKVWLPEYWPKCSKVHVKCPERWSWPQDNGTLRSSQNQKVCSPATARSLWRAKNNRTIKCTVLESGHCFSIVRILRLCALSLTLHSKSKAS